MSDVQYIICVYTLIYDIHDYATYEYCTSHGTRPAVFDSFNWPRSRSLFGPVISVKLFLVHEHAKWVAQWFYAPVMELDGICTLTMAESCSHLFSHPCQECCMPIFCSQYTTSHPTRWTRHTTSKGDGWLAVTGTLCIYMIHAHTI